MFWFFVKFLTQILVMYQAVISVLFIREAEETTAEKTVNTV